MTTTRTRTALVTGSAGFLGRHFVRHLNQRGYSIAHLDIRDVPPGTPAWFEKIDALDAFRNLSTFAFDLVVHCAAVVGGRTMIDGRPLHLASIDLELDAALWRWALETRPGRVLYLSSSAAYPTLYQGSAMVGQLAEWLITPPGGDGYAAAWLGRPDATYGLVKLVGEELAHAARAEGINVTVVRPFSGYGHDQALDYPFPAFIHRALAKVDPFPVWGTGDQVRDFIHVQDVVRMALDLAERGVDDAVNLCTGRPTSFRELAELVTAAAGYHPDIETRPDAPTGVHYRVGDPTLARSYGVEAHVTLEAGIAAALEAGR